MVDLSSLSNEQLLSMRQSMAGESDSQTTPGAKRVTIDTGNIGQPGDLSSMSNEQLLSLRDSVAVQPKRGVAEDIAKSGAAGFAKGVAGLVGAPGDIAEYGARGIDWLTQQVGQRLGVDVARRDSRNPTYGSEDVRKAIESVVGELPKPQTTAGEYAQTIGEFAPAAALGGGGVATRVAQTVIPAIASETAGQVTKGKPIEPWARGVAGLVGGVGAGIATRPNSAARALREQMPADVTPQQVTQAERLIADARQHGIELAWPEALSQVAQRPVLTNTMRHLEASPQTEAQMATFFGPRAQQVENAARQQFDNISPVNRDPSTIGPAIGREAEGHINDVRGMINTASEPFYQRSAGVRLNQQEMAQVRALPGYQEARDAVLHDPQLARYVRGLPEDSVGFLNEVKKQLDQARTNAASPVNSQQNMQRSAGYGLDATAVRDAARRASPDYDAALAIQSGGREQILQPILDGYIGKLARNDLTTRKAIDTLFPAKPLANSEREISNAVQTLANRNARAASDLVRSYVEEVFNKTAKDLQTGANQAGGAKFRTALVGDAQQEANLGSAISALPNGNHRWDGFSRFLDTLEAIGTRQGIGSRTAYNQAKDQIAGRGGLVRDAIKIGSNPMKALAPLAERYGEWRLGNHLGEIATIVTDRRSGNLLRAISRMDPRSGQAQSVALRLLAIGTATRPPPVNQPGR